MVLLKGHGPDGFRFFTNYESPKGASWQRSARRAGHLLARARSPGADPRRGRAAAGGGVGRVLRDSAIRVAARRLGLAAERADRIPRPARRACRRTARPRRRGRGRRAPRTGAGTCSCPTRSSSGRDRSGASTTAFATAARAPAGRSSGSRPDELLAPRPRLRLRACAASTLTPVQFTDDQVRMLTDASVDEARKVATEAAGEIEQNDDLTRGARQAASPRTPSPRSTASRTAARPRRTRSSASASPASSAPCAARPAPASTSAPSTRRSST